MRYTVLTLTLLFCSLVALSQQHGTYNFLRLDVSARAAGLNGSFVSVTDDPNLLFYNPAGLATLSSAKASLSYLKHLIDFHGGSISYGRPFAPLGFVGVGITYMNYGSFTETDASMNVLGSFGANEFAAVIGIGVPLNEHTNAGISLKGIFSTIASYRSSAIAIDLGLHHSIPSENITVGVSLLSFGRQLRVYNATRESLPLDFKVGITHRPQHLPALLNLNFHRLNEKQNSFFDRFTNFTFGGEFLMSDAMRLRVGYNNEQRRELKIGSGLGLTGISIGGGIVYGNTTVDYSFNSLGRIGALHRISLGLNL